MLNSARPCHPPGRKGVHHQPQLPLTRRICLWGETLPEPVRPCRTDRTTAPERARPRARQWPAEAGFSPLRTQIHNRLPTFHLRIGLPEGAIASWSAAALRRFCRPTSDPAGFFPHQVAYQASAGFSAIPNGGGPACRAEATRRRRRGGARKTTDGDKTGAVSRSALPPGRGEVEFLCYLDKA